MSPLPACAASLFADRLEFFFDAKQGDEKAEMSTLAVIKNTGRKP